MVTVPDNALGILDSIYANGSRCRLEISGQAEDERIEGKIRGGGIPVTLSASGGKVRLAWK